MKQLPRQPGFKEQRYTHLFSGPVELAPEAAAEPDTAPASVRGPSDRDRIAALETALADLRREFDEFRRRFE